MTTSLRFESAAGRKMERVITKPDPDSADVDLSQLEHSSPIEWENVLRYGQYLTDKGNDKGKVENLVKVARRSFFVPRPRFPS